MAEHYAYLRVGGSDCIELKNKTIELEIWDKKFKIGTVIIGKVGIKWLPKRKQRNKGSERTIRWEELDTR